LFLGGANNEELTVVHEGSLNLNDGELREDETQTQELLDGATEVKKSKCFAHVNTQFPKFLELQTQDSTDSSTSDSSIMDYAPMSRNNSFVPSMSNHRNVRFLCG
jgi:hypothetical protein